MARPWFKFLFNNEAHPSKPLLPLESLLVNCSFVHYQIMLMSNLLMPHCDKRDIESSPKLVLITTVLNSLLIIFSALRIYQPAAAGSLLEIFHAIQEILLIMNVEINAQSLTLTIVLSAFNVLTYCLFLKVDGSGGIDESLGSVEKQVAFYATMFLGSLVGFWCLLNVAFRIFASQHISQRYPSRRQFCSICDLIACLLMFTVAAISSIPLWPIDIKFVIHGDPSWDQVELWGRQFIAISSSFFIGMTFLVIRQARARERFEEFMRSVAGLVKTINHSTIMDFLREVEWTDGDIIILFRYPGWDEHGLANIVSLLYLIRDEASSGSPVTSQPPPFVTRTEKDVVYDSESRSDDICPSIRADDLELGLRSV
ncbi:hypothetical protein HYFRA_00008280 [Hymenoscyphus fraxineus]|uniref:Uncharacterized protein n=1 Tax=Hymenoscyphus fraxineus TaxID=746836 RepID=A0A9N9PNV4_9HELO|nr:hypothetical protein HYFRA_00008280 [Hymenoscyphus fraxineus]